MVTAPQTLEREDVSDPRAGAPRRLRLGLFGAALSSGNLGVEALAVSTLHGLIKAGVDPRVTFFDYRPGRHERTLSVGGRDVTVTTIGCNLSRRWHQPWNLVQMDLASRLGLGRRHPALKYLESLDAVLDLSAGDSFSDIYGDWRFRSIMLPKHIALRLGRPLVLLPQTYGPFEKPAARREAAQVVRGAAISIARDRHSYQILKELAGDAFDPQRQLQGVDVAFGLPPTPPDDDARAGVDAARKRHACLVGLNVSGLLFNDPQVAQQRFQFRDPYPPMIRNLLDRLLREDIGVLLVPHVLGTEDTSDRAACERLRSDLPPADRERVAISPPGLSASQTKWVIGRCDWFCGTRMHSTIGGISQGVPTAVIAYSDKAKGVFEGVDAGDDVIDPRVLDAPATVDALIQRFHDRAAARSRLAAALEKLTHELDRQFTKIVESVG